MSRRKIWVYRPDLRMKPILCAFLVSNYLTKPAISPMIGCSCNANCPLGATAEDNAHTLKLFKRAKSIRLL